MQTLIAIIGALSYYQLVFMVSDPPDWGCRDQGVTKAPDADINAFPLVSLADPRLLILSNSPRICQQERCLRGLPVSGGGGGRRTDL